MGKDYFQGNCIEDEDERLSERCHWRRVGFVIFLALAFALILGPLMGCASTDTITTSVCYMRHMGKTEEGYAVVMQACQSPEAFSASQQ